MISIAFRTTCCARVSRESYVFADISVVGVQD